MRIIAGRFRGRRLQSPPGMDTRPTSDRVREALFSMLASRVGAFDGLRVADLYAGSGALGFEALSRGAAHAAFVERDPQAIAAIRANAAALGVADAVRVIGGSAESLPRNEPFDLVFADPPYAAGSGTAVLRAVADAGWLAEGGWMSVETERRETVDAGGWTVEAEREIGRARITLISRPFLPSPPS
jgi:16S rRNA (guanine966-N2)-methyltransferase